LETPVLMCWLVCPLYIVTGARHLETVLDIHYS
jgi:hypothetical protein